MGAIPAGIVAALCCCTTRSVGRGSCVGKPNALPPGQPSSVAYEAMNPLRAVGRLRRWGQGNAAELPYLGTCFAYRWQNRFLTAAHNIAGLNMDEIAVETVRGLIQTATGLRFHPEADVAVIEFGSLQIKGAETEPFWTTANDWTLGEDIMAYGFPVDVLGKIGEIEPKPRLFKGYFQRFMPEHSTYTQYKYLAGEINFGCPFGLSGGPVFRPNAHEIVLGIATENLQSITSLQAYHEEIIAGRTIKEVEYREIISYGTVLMLSGISDWLEEWCPAHDNRRPPASLAQALGVAEVNDTSQT
jgi:hypothetical protein